MNLSESDKARFWNKVNVLDDDSCWPWNARLKETGYGQFDCLGTSIHAHRVAFVISGGVLTEEKPFVLHSCDNPPCCNPKHLRAGTQKENSDDRDRRGRHSSVTSPETIPRGKRHWNARLSDEDVATIRAMRSDGASQKDIAEKFNVLQSYVSQILSNKKRKISVC